MIKNVGIIGLFGLGLIVVSMVGSWYAQSKKDSLEVEPVAHKLQRDTSKFENARSVSMPLTLDFAGEKVPLNNADVIERMDRELLINTYWHTNTILMIKRANRWLPMITEELKKAGIPDDFKYIVAIETNFKNDTSPAGAVGFWQFLRATGIENNLEITDEVDERYDPIKSTQAAAKYLNRAYGKFDSWIMVAASYNRGVTGMKRAMEHQKEQNYYNLLLNEETSRYVFRILAAKLILENPEKYGYVINPTELYQPYKTNEIEVTKSIPSLVDWAQQHSISYRQLKKYNPWLRKDKLSITSGKTYLLYLPQ